MYKSIIFIVLLSFNLIFFTLISRQKHLISALLCLEGIILFTIIYILIYINYELILIIAAIVILLTVSVSRARIGLALLVSISRKRGNDSRINYIVLIC